MDYVYICRSGENEELRYSIRSVIKYCNPKNIWVVGGKPDWYIGKYLHVKNVGNKFDNINECYKTILKENNISEKFVLMNDDFFILNFPTQEYVYCEGLLKDKINKHTEKYGNSSYARALNGAFKELKKQGIEEPINYDIHVPMTFNKAQLRQVIDLSLSPRSMYGNLFINNPINIKDVKVYKDTSIINFDYKFISTEDNSFKTIKDKLKKIFPDKTMLEN